MGLTFVQILEGLFTCSFEPLSCVSFLGFDLALKNAPVVAFGMVGNVDLHCLCRKVDVEFAVGYAMSIVMNELFSSACLFR